MRMSLPCTLLVSLLVVDVPAVAADALPAATLRPHHITARVADLERAAAWYRRMLGCVVRRRGTHGPVAFVELALADFGISLIAPVHATSSPHPPAAAAGRGDATPAWVHIAFSTAAPDALYDALSAKGAALSSPQRAEDGRLHSFLLADSEGNEIEITADY